MSELGQKATFGESIQIRNKTPMKVASSFDHLVGAGKECGREGEAERLRGLEIDNEIDLLRLLDREVLGSGATQNPIHKSRDLRPYGMPKAGSIPKKPTLLGDLWPFIDGRHMLSIEPVDNHPAEVREDRARQHINGLDASGVEHLESSPHLLGIAGVDQDQL